MGDWNGLLDWLANGPRENGTEALRETAQRLVETLHQLGLDATVLPYLAHPLRLRSAGVIIFAGAVLYALLLRWSRPRAAFLVALVLPVLLLAELDFYIPVFGWFGAEEQYNVEAVISPQAPQRELIFAAHFDSKTDLLDHLQRAPVELGSVPIALLMIVTAAYAGFVRRPSPRIVSAVSIAACVYGFASFLSLTGGALVTARSHGALDDGAACAVLMRLGQRLHDNPPQSTRVRLVFLSGEEIGVHGSWRYAEDNFPSPPSIPTSVVNLEYLGAAPDFGVFGKEAFSLKRYPADPELLRDLNEIHKEQRGQPLYVTWYGAATDARSFLAHGIPALTLFSDPPGHPFPRHLHSAADTREKVGVEALESAVRLLEGFVRKEAITP